MFVNGTVFVLYYGAAEVNMILVSVNTVGKTCKVSLTKNNRTIMLTKEIDIQRSANLSVFKIIAKGLLQLFKPNQCWQNKI
ncbi:MAG: hypothetical protein AB1394_16795 [Bacteroidota bacterium]